MWRVVAWTIAQFLNLPIITATVTKPKQTSSYLHFHIKDDEWCHNFHIKDDEWCQKVHQYLLKRFFSGVHFRVWITFLPDSLWFVFYSKKCFPFQIMFLSIKLGEQLKVILTETFIGQHSLKPTQNNWLYF
jgi:hypothetical protein